MPTLTAAKRCCTAWTTGGGIEASAECCIAFARMHERHARESGRVAVPPGQTRPDNRVSSRPSPGAGKQLGSRRQGISKLETARKARNRSAD